jgi:hypothetical protein
MQEGKENDVNEFTIYRDVAVPVVAKIVHVRNIGGRLRRAFVCDCGDIPSQHSTALPAK